MNTKDTIDESSPVEAPGESAKPAYRITEPPKPQTPLLNRAQRRHLRKYITHKAALQARHVLAKRRRMAVKAEKRAKALAKQAKYVAGIID